VSREETVILVHGLWVHGLVMKLMAERIRCSGYRVLCYSYPSLRLTLTENAERLARFARGAGADRVHLVGHSLGGLVALKAAQSLPAPGRIVLAGAPFSDSFSAHRLRALPCGNALLGRSMAQWLADERPGGLERYDIGVIAGAMSIGLGRVIARDLPKPNDGVVCISETWAPGIRDHLVLNVSHTTMLFSTVVARQICTFLRDGRFDRRVGELNRP
jgi:pimeloyl-ACP methyl ester carboxylesterase